jgi:hypothetical protein
LTNFEATATVKTSWEDGSVGRNGQKTDQVNEQDDKKNCFDRTA